MDIQKEREAFEKLPEIKKRLDMKCVHFNGTWYATNPHMGNSFATASYLNGAWMAWQAAKAQAVPELTDKMIVAIESEVEIQLKASAIDADPFRLDGEKIWYAALEAQEPK